MIKPALAKNDAISGNMCRPGGLVNCSRMQGRYNHKEDMSHHPIRSPVDPAPIALSPRLRGLAKELVEALCHAKKQVNGIDPASHHGL